MSTSIARSQQWRSGLHLIARAATAAGLMVLAGCAPGPMRGDNLNAYLKETLVYEAPYQAVYKCFVESGYYPSTVLGVNYGGSQLYSELNLGVWYMGAERNIYKRIEFAPLSPTRSQVRIYAVLDYSREAERLTACGTRLETKLLGEATESGSEVLRAGAL